TVAGAAAGGYAGNKVQENIQNRSTYTTTETQCSTAYDSHEKVVGYKVRYDLDGKVGTVRMERDPGNRIPVEDGRLVLADRKLPTAETKLASSPLAGWLASFVMPRCQRGASALHGVREVRLDGGEHRLEALGVAGNDLALLEEFVTADEVADQTTGFLDQQGACGHVPLGEAEFPEGV